MKKVYKMMLVALCAVLLVATSVMGTLAYLQMSTQTVTNTFTVGKVEIELKEKYTAPDGTINTVENGVADIKLVPGREIEKNPFITVAQGSEDCYLFVRVVDNTNGYTKINWDNNSWKSVDGETNVYYYAGSVTQGTPIDVFKTITCGTAVDKYDKENDLTIVITAYAVQSEGFADATAAWNATFGKTTP